MQLDMKEFASLRNDLTFLKHHILNLASVFKDVRCNCNVCVACVDGCGAINGSSISNSAMIDSSDSKKDDVNYLPSTTTNVEAMDTAPFEIGAEKHLIKATENETAATDNENGSGTTVNLVADQPFPEIAISDVFTLHEPVASVVNDVAEQAESPAEEVIINSGASEGNSFNEDAKVKQAAQVKKRGSKPSAEAVIHALRDRDRGRNSKLDMRAEQIRHRISVKTMKLIYRYSKVCGVANTANKFDYTEVNIRKICEVYENIRKENRTTLSTVKSKTPKLKLSVKRKLSKVARTKPSDNYDDQTNNGSTSNESSPSSVILDESLNSSSSGSQRRQSKETSNKSFQAISTRSPAKNGHRRSTNGMGKSDSPETFYHPKLLFSPQQSRLALNRLDSLDLEASQRVEAAVEELIPSKSKPKKTTYQRETRSVMTQEQESQLYKVLKSCCEKGLPLNAKLVAYAAEQILNQGIVNEKEMVKVSDSWAYSCLMNCRKILSGL